MSRNSSIFLKYVNSRTSLTSLFRTLSKEIIEVRRAADLTLLNLLHEVGVTLFYKLISVYDSEVSSYFPTKILLKRMIDKLGFVSRDFRMYPVELGANKNGTFCTGLYR